MLHYSIQVQCKLIRLYLTVETKFCSLDGQLSSVIWQCDCDLTVFSGARDRNIISAILMELSKILLWSVIWPKKKRFEKKRLIIGNKSVPVSIINYNIFKFFEYSKSFENQASPLIRLRGWNISVTDSNSRDLGRRLHFLLTLAESRCLISG